ncbi:MAG: M81 family metallopeptidase [Ruminococcaceae bacterium]|nr:M81 family metallopeptidase [Oscillospiraceae bacterium]
MKIVIGSLQCEGNSLTPVKTRYEDFDYAKGEAMYEKIKVVDFFKERDCEIIPTIYAHALPGGPVIKEDYLRLAGELTDAVPKDGIDGIWLYLHGAMCVDEIGSGDTYLLKMIRDKVGYDIPISVAMDFHADNTDEIINMVNCVTAFRTAPHRDHTETQIRAAQNLITCIEEKILPHPVIERENVVICGDAVQTDLEPLKSIMEKAEEIENNIPEMMSVQVFNGQPWIDAPYMGPAVVVTHKSDSLLAKKYAREIADKFYEVRHDFKFLTEAVEPDEAIRLAMEASEKQVFISDSGDNTTAGAAGDNAYMINRIKEAGARNVLIAGVADSDACEKCYSVNIGDTVTLKVGASLDVKSESTVITGKVVHRGNILSYTGADAGESATVDCGDMTVVITKNRAAMCRPDIFESINLDYSKYKIVVVKLGYLFPELAKEAERSILAFTPGSSTERLEDMHMKNIRRPMFPIEDNFK